MDDRHARQTARCAGRLCGWGFIGRLTFVRFLRRERFNVELDIVPVETLPRIVCLYFDKLELPEPAEVFLVTLRDRLPGLIDETAHAIGQRACDCVLIGGACQKPL